MTGVEWTDSAHLLCIVCAGAVEKKDGGMRTIPGWSIHHSAQEQRAACILDGQRRRLLTGCRILHGIERRCAQEKTDISAECGAASNSSHNKFSRVDELYFGPFAFRACPILLHPLRHFRLLSIRREETALMMQSAHLQLNELPQPAGHQGCLRSGRIQ